MGKENIKMEITQYLEMNENEVPKRTSWNTAKVI